MVDMGRNMPPKATIATGHIPYQVLEKSWWAYFPILRALPSLGLGAVNIIAPNPPSQSFPGGVR